MKFGFVILHYKTQRDTVECVDSLLKLHGNYQIIIVDNYSNNGSLEYLKIKYESNRCIHIITSKANLGFAKGNNLGIKYAVKNNCDFVVLLNNDTIIEQRDFIEKCIYSWNKYNFSVAGPRIISLADGKDQNPFMVPRHFIKTKKEAVKLWTLGLVKYISILVGLPEWWESGDKKGDLTGGLEHKILYSDNEDFLLCGAAMILSPSYFSKYSKLCEYTFLYEEETIIFILSRLLGYSMLYDPNIIVYHKEKSSTNALVRGRKKLLFCYREDYKSRKNVLRIMLHKNNKLFLENLIK